MPQAKKILLLGKDGQLGFALQRSLSTVGYLHAFNRQTCDLRDVNRLHEVLQEVKPDVIINAAAMTAVDKAETQTELAFEVNANVPLHLAEWAKDNQAHLVHYSTDYVFDGKKYLPYQEEDVAAPLSQYGVSKLAGEKAIQSIGGQYWILRTSWVFSSYGNNFLKTILRLAKTRNELNVIDDQYGVPTSADFLADITAQLLQKAWGQYDIQPGLYHLVPEGKVSWYEFAQFIVAYAQKLGLTTQLTLGQINPIAAVEYPLPARRPYNSCLNTEKIGNTFDLVLPNWQGHAQHALQQLLQNPY